MAEFILQITGFIWSQKKNANPSKENEMLMLMTLNE